MSNLGQRLTAQFGWRAAFWRARAVVQRRWFVALRSLFHARHAVRETRTYGVVARALALNALVPIGVAALVVVALHFVERSWPGLISSLGLKHTAIGRAALRPIDRGTYAVLMQSVAAVTGVFLALYFTAVSTVAATVYTEVPHDIRDLMLRDKFGNVYVYAVAFVSALCVLLLGVEALGGAAYRLALPIVALLAVFAVFAFITLGRRAFYLSDPTLLGQLVLGDFGRWLKDASVNGWRWRDPNIQDQYRQRARRSLRSLVVLLEISRSHDYLRDDPERRVLTQIVGVLQGYVRARGRIPTESQWFGQTYEHRRWYLTDATAVGVANDTAGQLLPRTVPDVTWVERMLFTPILEAAATDLRSGRGESGYVVLESLLGVFEAFGTTLDVEAGIDWINRATTVVVAAVLSVSDAVPDTPVPAESVASVDILAAFSRSVHLGFARRLAGLDLKVTQSRLASKDWAKPGSSYDTELPRPVIQALEEVSTGTRFELAAKSTVHTPGWYAATSALNRLAWCVQEQVNVAIAHAETWFPTTADTFTAAQQHHAAAAVLSNGLELLRGLEQNLDRVRRLADQFAEIGWDDDLRRPSWDWPALDGRLDAFHRDVLTRMAASISPLAGQPRDKELPDYLGQAVHWSGQAAFRAVVDNDVVLFTALFEPYFLGALAIVSHLQSEVSTWPDTQSAISWMIEPVADLIDVSGYAIIFSELRSAPTIWDACRDVWDRYLGSSGNGNRVQWIAHVCAFRQRPLAIAPRTLLRTQREMEVTRILGDLPRAPGNGFDGTVQHPSALIRRIAPSGFSPIAFFDAADVFIVRYLMRQPGAQGLDFGVMVDKVESLSNLDDDSGGDE